MRQSLIHGYLWLLLYVTTIGFSRTEAQDHYVNPPKLDSTEIDLAEVSEQEGYWIPYPTPTKSNSQALASSVPAESSTTREDDSGVYYDTPPVVYVSPYSVGYYPYYAYPGYGYGYRPYGYRGGYYNRCGYGYGYGGYFGGSVGGVRFYGSFGNGGRIYGGGSYHGAYGYAGRH